MSEIIFISHSSKDKEFVDILVDTLLICGIGFTNHDIFCSSVDGLGIKTGKDWRNEIKEKLIGSKVIILFITPNYKESEICLNEMGAAWATAAKVIPIVVPPMNFKTIGVIFDVKQSVQLTKETDLDELKDTLRDFVSTTNSSTARWTAKKKEAIVDFEKELNQSPFLKPLSRDVLINVEKELAETKLAFDYVVDEKQKLSELCKKLEEAKDKSDVIAIKQDVGLLDDYYEFLSKAKEIGREINKFNPVVRTLIFNEFTKNSLSLTSDDRMSYKYELNQALAEKIIDDDETLNHQHRRILRVLNALDKFKTFFNNNLSTEIYEKLEYDYPDLLLETDSSDFWKEVFGVERLLF